MPLQKVKKRHMRAVEMKVTILAEKYHRSFPPNNLNIIFTFKTQMPPAVGIIEFKVSSIYIVMQSKREKNK